MPRATKKKRMRAHAFFYLSAIAMSPNKNKKEALYKQVDRQKKKGCGWIWRCIIHRERIYVDLIWCVAFYLFERKEAFCCMQSKRKEGSQRVATVWRCCVWRRTVKSILKIFLLCTYRVKHGTVCVCVCAHHNTLCVVLTARRRE